VPCLHGALSTSFDTTPCQFDALSFWFPPATRLFFFILSLHFHHPKGREPFCLPLCSLSLFFTRALKFSFPLCCFLSGRTIFFFFFGGFFFLTVSPFPFFSQTQNSLQKYANRPHRLVLSSRQRYFFGLFRYSCFFPGDIFRRAVSPPVADLSPSPVSVFFCFH